MITRALSLLFLALSIPFLASCGSGGGGESTIPDQTVPSSLNNVTLTLNPNGAERASFTFVSLDNSSSILSDRGLFTFANGVDGDQFSNEIGTPPGTGNEGGDYTYTVLNATTGEIVLENGFGSGDSSDSEALFGGDVSDTRIIVEFTSILPEGISDVPVTVIDSSGNVTNFEGRVEVLGNVLPFRYNGILTLPPAEPTFDPNVLPALSGETLTFNYSITETTVDEMGMEQMVTMDFVTTLSFNSVGLSSLFEDFGTITVDSTNRVGNMTPGDVSDTDLNNQNFLYRPNSSGQPIAELFYSTSDNQNESLLLRFDSATSGTVIQASTSRFRDGTFTVD